MGAVYEATHERLTKKKFAVKVLHRVGGGNDSIFARFRREAEITSELGHPHIVNVLDFHEMDDGRPYMIMEFLQGTNLGDRLKGGPLGLEELAHIMEQVGDGLQAAHDHDVVHRDMKPENIFLVESGGGRPVVKLLDFGISKIKHTASNLTATNMLMGTAYFMSPEQASGLAKEIDQAADIFAVGSICYLALAGRLPFKSPTLQGVIYQVCHHQPPLLSDLVDGIPGPVDQVIRKAMSKEPGARYSKITQFTHDLCRALRGETVELDAVAPSDPSADLGRIDRFDPHAETPVSSSEELRVIDTGSQEAISSEEALAATACSDPDLSLSTLARATGEQKVVAAPAGRGQKRMMMMGGAVALSAAVAFALWGLGGDPPAKTRSVTPTTSPPTLPVLPPPEEKPPPDKVPRPMPPNPVTTTSRIKLRLAPSNARVAVDGILMVDNPLLLVNGRSYGITVRAPRHRTEERTIDVKGDQTLDFELKKAPGTSSSSGRRPGHKISGGVGTSQATSPAKEPVSTTGPAPAAGTGTGTGAVPMKLGEDTVKY